jgi:hypothetical protein
MSCGWCRDGWVAGASAHVAAVAECGRGVLWLTAYNCTVPQLVPRQQLLGCNNICLGLE